MQNKTTLNQKINNDQLNNILNNINSIFVIVMKHQRKTKSKTLPLTSQNSNPKSDSQYYLENNYVLNFNQSCSELLLIYANYQSANDQV